MKVLCRVIALLLFITELTGSENLNVGTVLFTKDDLCRKCWTKSEKTLLCARQMIQGLLPDPEHLDITQPGAITVLLDYFRLCFEVIGQCACGNTQHLMFLALSDALGGYLRAYILPMTRQAYYAGQVKYAEASKIFKFYDDIKEYLSTNGAGWSKPQKCPSSCKVRPLKITTRGCEKACDQLYFREETKKDICRRLSEDTQMLQIPVSLSQNPSSLLERFVERKMSMKSQLGGTSRFARNAREEDSWDEEKGDRISSRKIFKRGSVRRKGKVSPSKVNSQLQRSTGDSLKCNLALNRSLGMDHSSCMNRKRKFTRKRQDCCNDTEQNQENSETKTIVIPLPILDDREKPHAIGLPFRVDPLRNIFSPQSACILVRYYITVIKCLVTKTHNKCDVVNFNGQFQTWMVTEIFPHLNDEEWYPAFGGVLRIEETIKRISSSDNNKCAGHNDIGFMFGKGFTCDESQNTKSEECQDAGDDNDSMSDDGQKQTYLTLGISAVVALWILMFCYCFCCYCPSGKGDGETCQSSKATGEKGATDVSNSFIIQCLIKFFKRNCGDEKGQSGELATEQSPDSINIEEDGNEGSLASRKMSPGSNYNYGRESGRLRENETVAAPAQLAPLKKEMPVGMTTFWPFSDYRHDINVVRPCPEVWMKSVNRIEGYPIQLQAEREGQFRTLWKRRNTVNRTSDSCTEGGLIHGQLEEANNRNRTNNKSRTKRKLSSNNSSYSEKISEGDNQQRLVFARKSQSAMEYPASYRCQYHTSPDTYSSSQTEEDVPVELYEHIAACHNSFAKSPRAAERRESRSGSDSELDLTSYSEKGRPLNRLP